MLLKNSLEEEAKELIEYYENLLSKFIDGGIESFEALVEKDYSIYGDISEEILDILEQERLNDFSKYYRNILNDQLKEIQENFFIGELSKKGNPTDRNIFNRLTNDFIENFIAEGQESFTVQSLKDLSNQTSINAKTKNLIRELERRLDILKNKKNGHYLVTVLNLRQYNEKNQTPEITSKQKEEAQTQYFQYIKQTGKKDIEGFKEFVENKENKSPNVLYNKKKLNYYQQAADDIYWNYVYGKTLSKSELD